MTAGTYGGGTFGTPWGVGGGLYVDNHGRIYPQVYGGSPGFQFSNGYTPNLEGLLTGPSISWSPGLGGPIRYNVGGNAEAIGAGVGTPGIGVTDGFGPYRIGDILESFRPTTDEYGQPFPGDGPTAALPPRNSSGNESVGPGNGNPVLRFLDSIRPRTDEFGNPFPGGKTTPQPAASMGPPPEQDSMGGVFKYYGERMPPLTAQELAGFLPNWPAKLDSELNPDAAPAIAPSIPRPTRRLVSSAFAGSNPLNPTPAPPPQTGRSLGIFTGGPMPDWPVPPPLGSFSNRSGAAGDGAGSNTMPLFEQYLRYLYGTNGG